MELIMPGKLSLKSFVFGKNISLAQSLALALLMALIGKHQISFERGMAVDEIRSAMTPENVERAVSERMAETKHDDPLYPALQKLQSSLREDPKLAGEFAKLLENKIIGGQGRSR